MAKRTAAGSATAEDRRSREVQPMTRAELLRLPASVKPETAFRAVGVGRSKGYELIRSGEFPARVLRLGSEYRVVTADLWELLGVEPEAQVGGGAA